MGSYKYTESVIGGQEYCTMKGHIFMKFAREFFSYLGVDEDYIENMFNQYNSASKIKRKRIRNKKEKKILLDVYDKFLAEVNKHKYNK